MKFRILHNGPVELGGGGYIDAGTFEDYNSNSNSSTYQSRPTKTKQQQEPTTTQQAQPFWDTYHDEHPCMQAEHPETAPARDVHVHVAHDLRPSKSSDSDSSSSGDEEDGHGPKRSKKYDDTHAQNMQLRSHSHRKSTRDSSEDSKRPRHSDTQSDAFDWNPPRHPPQPIMKKYISVNCLVKGDFVTSESRWLVPIDNTQASMRAFETCLKVADAMDHIVILHVREHDLTGLPLREVYREWYNAVVLCKRYYDLLISANRHPDSFTILVPVYHDARKIVIKFAKKLDIDTIVVGKHQEEDKKTRIKNQHWRTFTNYVTSNSKSIRTMVV